MNFNGKIALTNHLGFLASSAARTKMKSCHHVIPSPSPFVTSGNIATVRRYHHQRRRRSLLQDISGLTYLSGVMLDLGGNDKDISRTSNFSS